MERFDAMVPPTGTTPTSEDAPTDDGPSVFKGVKHTNGVKKEKVKKETIKKEELDESQNLSDDISEVEDRPKKKQRQAPVSDAKLAAMLQAQENSRARPSRSGVIKKAPVKRKPKKKSAVKIKGDDDSDVELNSDGEKKVVVRTGGFHVSLSFTSILIPF